MRTFSAFFEAAAGRAPYGFQERLARDGLPGVVEVPTGCGKTGIVLAWLWRWSQGPGPGLVPRRLVYALPQRSLVEQVASQVSQWLANLGMAEEVALHVVMGGAGETQRAWRLDMHRPAIMVGTVDSLVSKALNRGYGIARATFPVDFALVTNGAHWVIDEIQLCPESTTTLRQLAGFAKVLGTAEPFGLTCMSATVPEGLLGTVDNPVPAGREVLRIEPSERAGALARRLAAERTVRPLPIEPGDYAALAAAARERHRPGTLTLVVLNTVEAARAVFRHLPEGSFQRVLLHSQFRGVERQQLMGQITAEVEAAGRIIVATQVVEAGIDLDATVLITEAAPWPSIIQRAGRCNRAGRPGGGELWWVRPANPHPYLLEDVEASAGALSRLEGTTVTGESLTACNVAVAETPVAVLRRNDLVSLFDTAPDLSGADLDIAPYVRDADDLDVQLAWATWDTGGGAPAGGPKAPAADARAPGAEFRCRVPLSRLGALMKRDVSVWRLDQVLGRWSRVTPQARARPGEVLLVDAADGGYDPAAGFDPAARKPVPGCPELIAIGDVAEGAEEPYRADPASTSQDGWVGLDRHSEEVRAQAVGLLSALRPDLPGSAAQSVVTAAYLHDVGKAHSTWQDALCGLAPEEQRSDIERGRPWAKSAVSGRLVFDGGVPFRHELASLLLLDGPLNVLLADAPDADLVRYLVLAHHGKLRVQVRDPGDLAVLGRMNGGSRAPGRDGRTVLLGLEQDSAVEVPPVLGQPAARLIVDLEQFSLGGQRSWTRTAVALRDQYGPFILAYLEAVVRIADWRASAAMEIAGPSLGPAGPAAEPIRITGEAAR